MALLVTGGAGYVGSHAVRFLVAKGERVVVLDDLSLGPPGALEGLDVPVIAGDIADRAQVARILDEFDIEAVLHFAARALVGESMRDPQLYFMDNASKTLSFLAVLLEKGVRRFVLSSTAAVYGEPAQVPIPEEHPLQPTNPYGESKVFLETVLRRYDAAYGLRSISLRYFNAAGAAMPVPGRKDLPPIGEDHDPETHLIPLVLQVPLGKRERITVFGDDYPTPDGTAVRDYVHVDDLAQAHWLALEALRAGHPTASYNLGTGEGYSVLEVVKTARRVTNHPIQAEMGPRRPGDPAVLVASAEKAQRELGWRPRYSELETIVRSAWQWHSAHPNGFRGSGNQT